MVILVIALRINPRPLSALELKLSGLIMESRVDTAGDNQNAHMKISSYFMPDWGIVKTMPRGVVGSSMNYCPRPLGRVQLRIELSTAPRDIVLTILPNSHEITALLPN